MILATTRPLLGLLTLSLAILLGCDNKPAGPIRYETTGVVTFKGNPVPDAQVVFFGPGVSRGAITGEDGRFRVKAGTGGGLPVGEYSLVVRPAPGDDLETINYKRPDIPKKYWTKETSNLKKSIVEGENKLVFELSGD